MMYWDHGGWGAGDWVAMSLMMIVFWGAVIALVVWLVRSARSDQHTDTPAAPSAGADEVLADRYARGEIDDEEFSRRRELLHSAGKSPS